MAETIYIIGGVSLLITPILLVISLLLALMKQKYWKKSLLWPLSTLLLGLSIGFSAKFHQTHPNLVYAILCIGCVVYLVLFFRHIRKKTDEAKRTVEDVVETEKKRTIKTVLIDSSHDVTFKPNTGSVISRAIVGKELYGDVGAIFGASTAENDVIDHHTMTFLVYYDDGTRVLKTVDNTSKLYEIYMDKLETK